MKQDDIKEKIRKILRQGSCSLSSCAHLNKKIEEIESLITEARQSGYNEAMQETYNPDALMLCSKCNCVSHRVCGKCKQ